MNRSFIMYIKAIIVLIFLSSCNNINSHPLETQDSETQKRLEQKATEAIAFCEKNNYNTDFCILIDMKIHSGRNRMFVWNFKTKSIDKKALCAHGCGKGDNLSTGATPVFSNTEGSLCSSLGKYKLGIRSYSQWGINVHYKMYGLEKTNSNAYKRIIVFHSHTPMPDKEIYPQHLPMGWSFGCPVTSNKMMTYMDKKLQNSKKPTLMWIYF